MGSTRLIERTDTAVPLEVQVSSGLTGATALLALRHGTNNWLDWNDLTFKTVGWTTRQLPLTEVSAVNSPGDYFRSGGLDLTAVTNLPASGIELIEEYDVSSGTFQAYARSSFRLVDELDTIATQASVDAVQTAVDALDAAVDGCHISAAYDATGTAIAATLWLDRNGVTITAPTAITVIWYNEDGTVLFTHTDVDPEITGPDAQGIWRLQKVQVLADDQAFYISIAITDATGTITSVRGVPVVG